MICILCKCQMSVQCDSQASKQIISKTLCRCIARLYSAKCLYSRPTWVMFVVCSYLFASENAQPVASGLVHVEHAAVMSSDSKGGVV